MKNSPIKQLSMTSLYFLLAFSFAGAGLWAMLHIEASLFSMLVFGLLVAPSLLSTMLHLSKDISKVCSHSTRKATTA